MPALINSVNPDSIAEELELRPGDEIISIDKTQLRDLLDYQYFMASEKMTLHIKRCGGEEEIIDLEKDFCEDLGINFESAVFDRVIPCNNKCVFCFVDQQPPELRQSLYVKDDDYRLSYLQGTYVTLTNLKEEHRQRIKNLRLGPLYVSVHSTNPELRAFMLKNPGAANIVKELKWLNDLEIPVHAQIVLCPGINDGQELTRTLEDLSTLSSSIESIAVVPVGITKYRQGQTLLKVDKFKAEEVISTIGEFNREHGYNLAFASDEFYITAGYGFPESDYYDDFSQLDDGVGTCRTLLDDFEANRGRLPKSLSMPKEFTIATGQTACKVLAPIVNELNKINNLKIDLIGIKSNFWGEDVTVSGLITGSDLLDNLLPIKSGIKNLIIPSVMIRKLTDEFLDSVTLGQVKQKIGAPVHVIQDYYSTNELIELIIN